MTRAEFSLPAGRSIWHATREMLGLPVDLGSTRAHTNSPGQFRLAIIVEDAAGSSDQVDCDGVQVYGIQLIDATFPEVIGSQPLTYTLKDGQYHAAARPGQVFAYQDIVLVHWWNNRYWLGEVLTECNEATFCELPLTETTIADLVWPTGKYCADAEAVWVPGSLTASVVNANNTTGHTVTVIAGTENGFDYRQIEVEYTEGDGLHGFGILIDPGFVPVDTNTNELGYAITGRSQISIMNSIEGPVQAAAAGLTHLSAYLTKTLQFLSESGGNYYSGSAVNLSTPCWLEYESDFLTGYSYDDCETEVVDASPDPRHPGEITPMYRVDLDKLFGVSGTVRKLSFRVANLKTKTTRTAHYWNGADPWRTWMTPSSTIAITKPAVSPPSAAFDAWYEAAAAASFTATHAYSVVIDYGTRGTITYTVDPCVATADNPGLFYGEFALPGTTRSDGTKLVRFYYLRIASTECSFVSTLGAGSSGPVNSKTANFWVVRDDGTGALFLQNIDPGTTYDQQQPYGDCPAYFNGDGLTKHTSFGAPGLVNVKVDVVASQ